MPETTDRDAPNWTIAMPGMRTRDERWAAERQLHLPVDVD
jgi:hypothetical protein